jgi:alpha-D-ribose 1-methylphosphonate 5-triphosphate synthase subunit PhnL
MRNRNSGVPAIVVDGLAKTFILHTQGGARIPVFSALDLEVAPGECVALHGPSGSGKSTLMRSLYANYKPDAGSIRILHDGAPVDIVRAGPRAVLDIRRRTIGYVSQFLRVIPRVPTLDIVAEPLRALGVPAEDARERAAAMLARLDIPEPLRSLAPATFSGGEQQRVNVARGFVADYPILLLDEPTASLDAANRQAVVELIGEARARGAAIVGIFHDAAIRAAVADRVFEIASPVTELVGDAA